MLHDNDKAILGNLVVSEGLGFVVDHLAVRNKLLRINRNVEVLSNLGAQLSNLHKAKQIVVVSQMSSLRMALQICFSSLASLTLQVAALIKLGAWPKTMLAQESLYEA